MAVKIAHRLRRVSQQVLKGEPADTSVIKSHVTIPSL